MKTYKYILSIILFVAAIISCTEDEFGSLDFVDTVVAPTNVTALFSVTQDNTGTVTIAPNSEGAVSYHVYPGDETTEALKIAQGKSVTRVYPEGNYDVKILATGITGLKTEVTLPLVVSFKAPENLVTEILNDEAVSKKLNVTANADHATSYDVYFGEEGNDEPIPANIGETASYVYAEPGVYTVKIVAKGAAIATAEYTEEFEVTEILQPIESAVTPSERADTDVVSIFSDAYENSAISEWNPNWGGQSTVLSPFDLNGDNMLKYDFFSYTGIVTSYDNPTNLSTMEYVHFDYWTNDATQLGFKIVNTAYGDGDPLKDSEVITPITESGKWVSVDIPLTDFTTDLSGVTQLVLSSTGVTVFMDNIYFWKEPSEVGTALLHDDFEGNGNITTWFGDACGMDNAFTNPQVNIGNNSATVLKYDDTGEQYANVRFDAPSKLDLASNSKFSLKIYVESSSVSGNQPKQISLKLQDGTASEPWVLQTEIIKTIVFDQWQTVTFDFATDVTAGQPDPLSRTDFDRVVLQVNSEGNSDTVLAYIDDFNYGVSTVGKPVFDDGLLTNGDFENGAAPWTIGVGSDPAPVVTMGDNSYYSVDVTAAGNAYDVNMSQKLEIIADATYTLTFDAWSDINRPIVAGIGLSADPWSNTIETVNITTDRKTYTLTLNADGYGAADARVLFDLGAAAGMVNIDNVSLFSGDTGGGTPPPSSGTQIDLPVDFESTTVDYTLTDFGENSSSLVTDPTDANNTVVKVVKTAIAATWAGTTIGTDSGFATNIPITLTNSKITVRVWSPDAGTPIRLKIEDANDKTHTCETEVNTTVTAGWETLEFDFTNQAPGTELLSVGLNNGWVYNKASIFFNFGTDGATAGEKTYYFDDVMFIAN